MDPSQVQPLVNTGQIAQAQSLFDTFAWETFLALNSPADANGNPDTSVQTDDPQQPRVWEFFRESGSVFLPDGAQPEPWNSASFKTLAAQVKRGEAPKRRLWMTSLGSRKSANEANQLDESFQAFTGPLVDLNGNWVRYEVLINKTEFDYIYQNELYNLDGQATFTAKGPINFPANDGTNQPGSMEIKLAWKQLAGNDDPSRFFVRQGQVVHYDAGPDGVQTVGRVTTETMGLVGMHIAVRTQSSPTWLWATFEHVDNVNVNSLDLDSKGRTRRPNFYNPETPVAPVNQLPPQNARLASGAPLTTWAENLTTTPTQVLQVLPVPGGTEAINAKFQAMLLSQGSVFKNYKLIGTQWPTAPNFPAFPGGMLFGTNNSSSPESIIYKTPGKMVPTYLINTTMETFFQLGNQKAGPLEEDDRLPSGTVSDSQIVFGTESCVGCHYSAGACIGFKTDLQGRLVLDANGKRIPIFGKNANSGLTGSANYSWLLQMRAQAKPYPPALNQVKRSKPTP
ncbi:hypothetical protein JRI60_43615 [Archangium violaceum]|uniref:hypothetical protein n=1 Tax=Archangium violaceum TaxID=83451 RepID=UPI00194E9A8C|nr:hypothetical protein [Archangium violaceum]QRN95864.1 hypothetical protein JRI60_43615 [Archangium violaceum]